MFLKRILLYTLLVFSTTLHSQITKEEEDLISPSRSFSSHLDYSINLSLLGLISTEEDLPFWIYHNRRGRVDKNSDFATLFSGKQVIFFTSTSYLISGAGILFFNGSENILAIDELYLHFQNNWMYAAAGRKQQKEFFNGLSSSNRSILWSLNTRPMWGVEIGTAEPFFLSGEAGLGFEASWSEYWMGKNRFVKDALLHHKSFDFVYRKGTWEIKAGVQHFAQWAGTSEEGEQPDGWKNYWRVITKQKGGTDAGIGDQLNALGNHLGGYELSVAKELKNFRFYISYNHLFEDGSGMMLRNTPDGRYLIYLEKKDKASLVNSMMYEFYYTQNQSFYFPNTDGRDNYFNNGVYRSGWTYNDLVIGSPLFSVDPKGEGIINNKFTAHHLGIGGEIGNAVHSYPYKLLLTYARNDGLYSEKFNPKQDVLYLLSEFRLLQDEFELNLQIGADWNNYQSPIYGVGLQMNFKM